MPGVPKHRIITAGLRNTRDHGAEREHCSFKGANIIEIRKSSETLSERRPRDRTFRRSL
jgi:hypothetical protein